MTADPGTTPGGIPDALRLDDPALAHDPYPRFAALRAAGPVAPSADGSRLFVLRHAEVAAALRDRRLGRIFHHRYTPAEIGVPPGEPAWLDARLPEIAAFERWELLALEPPEHTRLRRLVLEAFTPRAIAQLAPRIRARAAELLGAARAAGGGTLELVGGYAEPFSLGVICDLLGIPDALRAGLVPLSHRIVGIYEPGVTPTRAADADAAAGTMRALFGDLVRERRRTGGDDLIAALAGARVDGTGLSDDQVVSTAMVLLMAGHEATVNATGNGIAALAAHPDAWARLVDGSVAPEVAAEEVLRWDAPLQLFERWVLDAGVEIGGVPCPVGTRIALLLGAANRDPLRFRDPDRFIVDRGDAGHVAFGGGIHFCLGAPLARLELATTLGLLARTFPRLLLTAPAERRPGFQFRGYARLQLRDPDADG